MSANMPAGRELDRLVAEKVFGSTAPHHIMPEYDLPPFSTDMGAAWEVVRRMAERGFPLWHLGALVTLGEPSENSVFCQFAKGWPPTWVRAEAETAPQAICLAALKAVVVRSSRGGESQ